MRGFFSILSGFSLLFLAVACGKSEDAKNDKFRDWSVRDERKVPKAPSFLDGYEKEYGNRKQQKGNP